MFDSADELKAKITKYLITQKDVCIIKDIPSAFKNPEYNIDLLKLKDDEITSYSIAYSNIDYDKAFLKAWKIQRDKLANRSFIVLPREVFLKRKNTILQMRNLYFKDIGILSMSDLKMTPIRKAKKINLETIEENNFIRNLIIFNYKERN